LREIIKQHNLNYQVIEGQLCGDPAVVMGSLMIVREPGCYQVLRQASDDWSAHNIWDADGEPHASFDDAANDMVAELRKGENP
jgi:hypothetical protein